jgi:hypothetical protein
VDAGADFVDAPEDPFDDELLDEPPSVDFDDESDDPDVDEPDELEPDELGALDDEPERLSVR